MAIGNLQGLSDLAKVAAGRKGKEVLTVSLDDVESKEQVRKNFKNIEELADSMLEEGQQTPIIVYPKNEQGKYVIQKGERRWRALRVAGIETIDIIVNDKAQSELDETAGELVENIQRDDLEPMEIAYALKKFADEGWKQADIAKRIGKTAVYVSTHLSLLKLPDCVMDLYEQGICGDTETLNNLRLLYDISEEMCEEACDRALEFGGISRKVSRKILNAAKNPEIEKPEEAAEAAQGEDRPVAGVIGGESEQPESGGYMPPETEDGSESANEQGDGEEGGEESQAAQKPKKKSDSETKKKPEPKHQDAMPPLPADKDWRFTEPQNLIVVVNVPTETDIKRGILLLDRVCKDPKQVWVKVAEGSGEKEIKVLASEIELVGMEA
ncbi:ParB/RepB/Spo0J family partition protein [Marinobacter sp. G11]|uniref:ParB/RepB/Spo0J family partition protein n=1 Tax=Marinobacter sp. G11 TaxID=2903522 RepID=UPI003FA54322|nr:ParB/RepB/Spo0J family partition protein [Marinobacter sp. G11]